MLYTAKQTKRNAWVGIVNPNDSYNRTLLQLLIKDNQNLLDYKEIKLETSITKEKLSKVDLIKSV